MENGTSSVLLQLEGLMVPPSSRSLVFLSLLLSHVFIVGSNLGVVALVWSERALHQPMYLLMCNLAVNDVMNNLVVVPRILWDMLLPVHRPYLLIMSARTLVNITVFSLGLGFLLVGGLLGLSLRLTRCRYFIPSIHCTNASLFNLSCQNTVINNVYGITFTVVLLSIGSVVLTYGFITVACLTTRSRSLNRKYMQYGNLSAILYNIIPPALNPFIYAFQCREIHQSLLSTVANFHPLS
uniref:G-protein coupled receptors family 1 profile domain-containing protein n=1 Tax=Neogobius melanostomus TaxID=47308 RepID=A0A8C6T3D0_9GOBI